jgi:hypothetical protein
MAEGVWWCHSFEHLTLFFGQFERIILIDCWLNFGHSLAKGVHKAPLTGGFGRTPAGGCDLLFGSGLVSVFLHRMERSIS